MKSLGVAAEVTIITSLMLDKFPQLLVPAGIALIAGIITAETEPTQTSKYLNSKFSNMFIFPNK